MALFYYFEETALAPRRHLSWGSGLRLSVCVFLLFPCVCVHKSISFCLLLPKKKGGKRNEPVAIGHSTASQVPADDAAVAAVEQQQSTCVAFISSSSSFASVSVCDY